MARNIFYFSIFILMFSGLTAVKGQFSQLKSDSFYSSTLEENRDYLIYLPGTYNPSDETKRFPVIYFLHGAEVNQTAYMNIKDVLDFMILTNQIDPCLAVLPDGSKGPYAGSFYTNSELYGDFEDYIVEDLINHIDDTYLSIPDKAKRAIAGHSMGGYGAMKIGLKHPELFVGAVSHSGPLNIALLDIMLDDILTENGGQAPYTFEPDPVRDLTFLAYSMAGAFSPDLDQEYLVDFPIDENGALKSSVLTKWEPHNVSNLAADFDFSSRLKIYFDCGHNDHFKLMPQNQSFRDSLKKYAIPYEFREHKGGHSDMLLIQTNISINRINDWFATDPTKIQSEKSIPDISIYPNPATDNLYIDFGINSGLKKYELFNHLGQSIYQKEISPDRNKIHIDISSFEQGMYFIRITTNQGSINDIFIKNR